MTRTEDAIGWVNHGIHQITQQLAPFLLQKPPQHHSRFAKIPDFFKKSGIWYYCKPN